MTKQNIANFIDHVKKLNIDQLFDLINSNDPLYNYPIFNIIILSGINLNDFKTLITKINIDLFLNKKFINYYYIIDYLAFDYLYELLTFIKYINKDFFDIIMFQYVISSLEFTKLNLYFAKYIFQHLSESFYLQFWNLIKDVNLIYPQDNNLLITITLKYIDYNYPVIIDIIKEYITICPDILNVSHVEPYFIFIIYELCSIYLFEFNNIVSSKNNDNSLTNLDSTQKYTYKNSRSKSYKNKTITIYKNKSLKILKGGSSDIDIISKFIIEYKMEPYIIKLLDTILDAYPFLVDQNGYENKTGLIYAINNNYIDLIKYLLNRNADINYSGYNGKSINIFEEVLYANKEIHKIFINILDKIDFFYYNTNIDSYAMIAFTIPNHFDVKFKQLLLKYTNNLDQPNFFKDNILHIILNKSFNDDLKLYIDILINKKLNWIQQNIDNNITPLDLIDPNNDFIINHFFIPNIIHNINQNIKSKHVLHSDKLIINKIIKNLKLNNYNDFLNIKLSDLNNNINHYIFDLYRSYIGSEIQYNTTPVNNLMILEFQYAESAIFNCSTFEIFLYTFNILNKYDNLAIPYLHKNYIDNNFKCNNFKKEINKQYLSTDKINACESIHHYIDYFKIYPSLYFAVTLIWNSNLAYNIPYKLGKAIRTVYKNTKKYIFFINLNIIYDSENRHSNMIIINLKKKYAIRFEPGGGPVGSHFMKPFDDIFQLFLNSTFKSNIDFKYFTPIQYMPHFMFQVISGEGNFYFNKFEEKGYCLAWCCWFVESYMLYHSHINTLNDLISFIHKLSNKILLKYRTFIDYIREYANHLKMGAIKILKKLNFPDDRLYSVTYSPNDFNKILSYMQPKIYHLLH